MKKNIACTFNYRGKELTGYIIGSTDMDPHFYWFILNDPEALQLAEDTIAFMVVDGKMEPVYKEEHDAELLKIVQKLIEEKISQAQAAGY